MKCLGQVGVVLLVTLSLVSSKPSDTTTARYTLQGNNTIPNQNFTHLSLNIPHVVPINKNNSNVHRSGKIGGYNSRQSKQPKNELFYNEMLLKQLSPTLFFSFNSSSEARKLHKSRDKILLNNFFKNNLEDLTTPNKTLKINTVHALDTKNVLTVTTNTVSSSTTLKPGTSKNVQVYATKAPFRIRLNKVTTKAPSRVKTNRVATGSSTKSALNKLTTTTTKSPHTRRRPVLKTNQNKVTRPPITIKLTKVTTKRPISNSSPTLKYALAPSSIKNKVVHRNSTQTKVSSSSIRNKKKPIIHKVITKWSDTPNINEIKQNWYEDIPVPAPMPEISSYSPQYSISDNLGSIEDLDPVVPDVPDLQEPQSPEQISDPISTFSLDMLPGDDTKDAGGNGCPTVHIASSVLSAAQRQDCSDLNLVINSHYHQNTVTRSPEVDTYAADEGVGAAEADETAAEEPEAAADPPVADAVPQADSAGGGLPTPGSGGSGGSGGNGGDGSDAGGLSWPDFKGLMDALGHIWGALRHVLSFFKNPYLYAIPAALFFALGFVMVLALFPWWIPLLFLFLGVKSNQKSNVTYHKHVHKPVHHPDGWFWNHQTKTWQNVGDYIHRRVGDDVRGVTNIPSNINEFAKRYGGMNQNIPSWKWRRRVR